MSVDLVVVTEENVKSVLFRDSGGVSSTTSPLSESSRGITFFLKKGGDGLFFGPERSSSVIGTNRRMSGMLAGHQVASERTANRGTGQGLGKTNSFPGEPVDYGRLDQRVPHMSELEISQLVGHQINHVRFFWGCLGQNRKTKEAENLSIHIATNLSF